MAVHTRRREFIAALGCTAAWSVVSRAHCAGKLPTIGFLGANSAGTTSQWVAAFVQRLHGLGWSEGHTVAIEYRWADGRPERFAEICNELVQIKVDVIVTYTNQAAIAAKQATTTIPIVFAAAGDPVGTGLVAGLAQPGGNLTGLSIQQVDTVSKRVALLREILPDLHTLAVLANVGSSNAVLDMQAAQTAASVLGLHVITSEIRRPDDIAPAFDALRGRAEALYLCTDPLLTTNQVRLNTLALAARLPTMHGFREYVQSGGLMSYGPNLPDLFRRAADLVSKILHGAKAGDIPVEQPVKFDLVINLTTAKALGLTIPESFLLRANDVID